MGWREAVRDCVYAAEHTDEWGESYFDADKLAPGLLNMPTPDRIALARELLEGTGRVVARKMRAATAADIHPICAEHEAWGRGWGKGWNACRAAMLADDDGDG